MEFRALGKTGLSVSALGLGASPLGGAFGDLEAHEGIAAVHAALDAGINFIDVAPYYGLTRAETVLGQALATRPRDSFLLATKVGRYGAADFDFSAARVLASIDESLKRLQVEYIDLIQCHDIEFGDLNEIVETTLPALEQARAMGKVRFLGITGLPLAIYRPVLERAPLDAILSYCHYTLNDDSLAAQIPYFQRKNVGIINAAPYAMGLLTERPLPDWHPAPPALREAARQAADLCRRRGVSISQIALQFACANPVIATTLVGIGSRDEVRQNLAALSAVPDPELLAEVRALFAPVHNLTWPSGRPENNGPA